MLVGFPHAELGSPVLLKAVEKEEKNAPVNGPIKASVIISGPTGFVV